MQPVLEKVEYLTKKLLERACEVKHGSVATCFTIHNGRITEITSTTSISVRDYLNDLAEFEKGANK